jgi:hypothetical protein
MRWIAGSFAEGRNGDQGIWIGGNLRPRVVFDIFEANLLAGFHNEVD